MGDIGNHQNSLHSRTPLRWWQRTQRVCFLFSSWSMFLKIVVFYPIMGRFWNTPSVNWELTVTSLVAICAGNSPVTGEFPAQRPVTRSFYVFFDLRLNERLSKQSWGWWFETPSRPLWHHRNVDYVAGQKAVSQHMFKWWHGTERRTIDKSLNKDNFLMRCIKIESFAKYIFEFYHPLSCGFIVCNICAIIMYRRRLIVVVMIWMMPLLCKS